MRKPSKEEVNRHYRSRQETLWEGQYKAGEADQILRWNRILELCGNLKGKTVLDLGCADGVLSILAAKRGASVTGVDISPLNAEAAEEHAREAGVVVEFLEGDVEILDLGRKFDVVFAAEILEHLISPERALSVSFNHLKDDGLLVVTVPNPNTLRRVKNRAVKIVSRPLKEGVSRETFSIPKLFIPQEDTSYGTTGLPHHDYSVSFLKDMLEKEGFEVVSVKAAGVFIEAYYGSGLISLFGRVLDKCLSSIYPFNQMGIHNVICCRRKSR